MGFARPPGACKLQNEEPADPVVMRRGQLATAFKKGGHRVQGLGLRRLKNLRACSCLLALWVIFGFYRVVNTVIKEQKMETFVDSVERASSCCPSSGLGTTFWWFYLLSPAPRIPYIIPI